MQANTQDKALSQRIVITGVGLTSPNGNNLQEYRQNLLDGVSGISDYNIRYIGDTFAGVCDFDKLKYQTKKELRVGTRAGSVSIYCAGEALSDSGLDLETIDKSRVGVFVGTTEHGNVETENEIYNISKFDYDVKYWTHHHNPRTVANNPAGEVTVKFGITGPHYCLGAACAAGNVGLINGLQQLLLGEVDVALAGGISESIHTFGIFAAFKSQGALAENAVAAKASRPFDIDRNGIVISEGGALYTLERLDDALARGAKIYGEITGYNINSDATNFVLPNNERQAECMHKALNKAGLNASDINIVNTHGTGTSAGDIQESKAINAVFGESENTYVNNTKGFIGHAMGGAGALELAGNLLSFEDNKVHACMNADNVDPACAVKNLVTKEAVDLSSVDHILNNSFGMLGINSALIVSRFLGE
ncbi:beta-ketoacyl-[acyl-carrier-protein] synthase family protein [Lentisphaera profundi]|uniref:Beta-ketoacyl-[acyl-carrier-protein] synthase family protein n=1 Tax=Lentisphaera profundi TaxID=1658616 RepID=A0ABY7VPG8_9BACT|nr:beta-ketoacyl-[acyl-carrier-protein] synthase family protein [Lentisphaera profundi]WDE95882.1 beta-ketoacyl-[acyl-carrier-protein] synthase family protein [Lentisphaera profundi]